MATRVPRIRAVKTDNPYQDIIRLFEELVEELETTIQIIMVKSGLDRDSNLVKSVEIDLTANKNNIFFELYLNEYYIYQDRGRKPNQPQRRWPSGKRSKFYTALVEWIRKKNIRGRGYKGKFIKATQLAFIFMRAIDKNGFPGKHFMKPVLIAMDDTVKYVLDNKILNLITQDLDKIFSTT